MLFIYSTFHNYTSSQTLTLLGTPQQINYSPKIHDVNTCGNNMTPYLKDLKEKY